MSGISKKKIVKSAALILMMSLAACAKKSDDGGNTAPTAPAPQAPKEVDPIVGVWEGPCGEADLFGLSQNSVLTVEEGRMSKLMRYHAKGNCTDESVQVTAEATYSKGAEVRTNVNAIDITVNRILVKPLTETGLSILKVGNFCGQSDWVLGQAKDVSDLTGKPNCFPKVPQTMFDIYSLDGPKLFFGKGGDVTAPDKRPSELNTEAPYTKK